MQYERLNTFLVFVVEFLDIVFDKIRKTDELFIFVLGIHEKWMEYTVWVENYMKTFIEGIFETG